LGVRLAAAYAFADPLVALVFVRGKVFEQALHQAQAEGRVTPDLTAALHDPAVRAAHVYARCPGGDRRLDGAQAVLTWFRSA
jgi:hypothetical protein